MEIPSGFEATIEARLVPKKFCHGVFVNFVAHRSQVVRNSRSATFFLDKSYARQRLIPIELLIPWILIDNSLHFVNFYLRQGE